MQSNHNKNKIISSFALAFALFVSQPQPSTAAVHTWSGNVSGLWNVAANWSGGAPTAGEGPVALIFPSGATRIKTTNNISGLSAGSITLSGDNYILAGTGGGTSLALTGNNNIWFLVTGTNNRVDSSLSLTLNAAGKISISPYASLQIDSVMSGSGGFTKTGNGHLYFGGTVNNTYAGTTTIESGNVYLGRAVLQSGVWVPRISIPGPFIVGIGSTNLLPYVELQYGEQISSNVVPVVTENSFLYFQGATQTVAGLQMSGGEIDTRKTSGSRGLLRLNGNVSGLLDASVIKGEVSMAAGNRTIFTTNHAELWIDANIAQSGGTLNINKTGTGDLRLTGTNTFTGNIQVYAGTLTADSPLALGTTNGPTIIEDGAQIAVYDDIVGEPLTMYGMGTTNSASEGFTDGIEPATYRTYNSSWSGPITLGTDVLISVTPGGTLELTGPISGAGGLVKADPKGTLLLSGSAAITAAGAFRIQEGELQLAKTFPRGGAGAIPSLEISGASASVLLMASNQFDNTSVVRLLESGTLGLNGYTASIGNLTLSGGEIKSGGAGLPDNPAALLVLSGSLTASNGFTTIEVPISLGGATRTFHLIDDPLLVIYAPIAEGSGPAGLIVSGDGDLALNATNTFTGSLTIKNGAIVSAANARGFGTTNNPIIVESGGTLDLYELGVTNRVLSLGGTLKYTKDCYWVGPVTMTTNSQIVPKNATDSLDISGPISGPWGLNYLGKTVTDFFFTNSSLLRLSGATSNSFAGVMTVNDGTLELAKGAGKLAVPGAFQLISNAIIRWTASDQISSLLPMTVPNQAKLDLNGNNQTLASLSGNGAVKLGSGTLFVGQNNISTLFSGNISGAGGGLQKIGAGTLTLTGTNLFSGSTTVQAGKLIVDGIQNGGGIVIQPGAILGGHGAVGAMNVIGGGMVSPGSSPGKLSTGSASFNATGQFQVELNGVTPGTEYDQLNVTGTVNLTGSKLNIDLGFTPAINDTFTIIQNDGADAVFGTFANQPDNTVFVVGTNVFRINYNAGTGNDVVLTYLGVITPPLLGCPKKLTTGQAQLSGMGFPGMTCTVYANTNLTTTNWINIGSATANGQGVLQFVDTNAMNYPMRFYRFTAP